MHENLADLPDRNLAYFEEGSTHFNAYFEAVGWAQDYARQNRELMMANVIAATRQSLGRPSETDALAVNCHHNDVQRETHFGASIFVTRKGAVSARRGNWASFRGRWARVVLLCAKIRGSE